jgi:hypothetical protein
MQPAQELQRVGDFDACRIKCRPVNGSCRVQGPERAAGIDLLPEREQRLIAEGEEGPRSVAKT